MTPEWVHPGFVLIVGAWLVPLLKGVTKRAAMVLLPASALVLCILMEPGTHGVVRFLGQESLNGQTRVLRSIESREIALTVRTEASGMMQG